MFDAKSLLDQLVGSGVAGGFAGGLAGGGLAYKAWQNYQQDPAAGAAADPGFTTPPEGSAFLPASNDTAAISAP